MSWTLARVECKRADAPKITPSVHSALEDLQLEAVAIVYPGKSMRFSDGMRSIRYDQIAELNTAIADTMKIRNYLGGISW